MTLGPEGQTSPCSPAEICTDVDTAQEAEMTQIGLVMLILALFATLTSPFLHADLQTFAGLTLHLTQEIRITTQRMH